MLETLLILLELMQVGVKDKVFPKPFLIKKAGIIFQHCKLVNLFSISTLLRPPFF